MRITAAKLTQISMTKPIRPKTAYNIISDDWLGFLGKVTAVLCSVGVDVVLKLVEVESVVIVTIKVGTGESVLDEASELCSSVVVATIDGRVIDKLLGTGDILGCTSMVEVGLAVEYDVATRSVEDSVGTSINVAHFVFEFRRITPGVHVKSM